MKGHQAGQTRTLRTETSTRSKADEHPIHRLQRTAGNRAVTSLVEMHLQRKAGPAQPEKTQSKASPAAQAMFDMSIVEPIKRAVGLMQGKKRAGAIKELETSRIGAINLAKTVANNGPRFDAYMAFADNIGDYQRELKPSPLGEMASRMQTLLLGEAERVKVHTLT